jgi:hypothetical protein
VTYAFLPFEAKCGGCKIAQHGPANAPAAKRCVRFRKGGRMIKAYMNYPNCNITVHRNPNCLQAKVGPKQSVRHVIINADNLSKELNKFRSNKHKLSAETGMNDIYLILDFGDPVFEEALVGHIKRLVGLNYEEIKNSDMLVHC